MNRDRGAKTKCLTPVFNGPASKVGPDGKLRLPLNGVRKKNPPVQQRPDSKAFFQLITDCQEDLLRAKAFVVSQEDMLEPVDRLHAEEASSLSDEEQSLFQVKIIDSGKIHRD